jgi:hypothetical protein
MGRRGGKASGEARRRAKTLRESLKTLLALPVADKQDENTLKLLGFADANNLNLLVAKCYLKAVGGDIRAARLLFEISGEDSLAQAREEKIRAEIERLKADDGGGFEALREQLTAVFGGVALADKGDKTGDN